MTTQWKPGDVVMLASGGARMTVKQVGEDDFGEPAVWCIWQEAKGKGYVETVRAYPPSVLVSGKRSAGVFVGRA